MLLPPDENCVSHCMWDLKKKNFLFFQEMPPYMNPWMSVRPPQQAYFTTTGPIETSFIPRVSEGIASMFTFYGTGLSSFVCCYLVLICGLIKGM